MKDKTKFKEKFVNFFKPHYNEVSIFVMILSPLILFFVDDIFKADFISFFFKGNIKIKLVGIFLLLCTLISVYHVFSKKKKSTGAKDAMIFVPMVLNIFTAFTAGMYELENTRGFLIIFPAINLITAFIIMFMYKNNVINASSISDKDATLKEIAMGALVVFAIIVASKYFLLYWGTTLSMINVYASLFKKQPIPIKKSATT